MMRFLRVLAVGSLTLLSGSVLSFSDDHPDCCAKVSSLACGGMPTYEYLKEIPEVVEKSQILFEGRVVKAETLSCCDHLADVSFRVERAWKGIDSTGPDTVTVRVTTRDGNRFVARRRYLLAVKTCDDAKDLLCQDCLFRPHLAYEPDDLVPRVDTLDPFVKALDALRPSKRGQAHLPVNEAPSGAQPPRDTVISPVYGEAQGLRDDSPCAPCARPRPRGRMLVKLGNMPRLAKATQILFLGRVVRTETLACNDRLKDVSFRIAKAWKGFDRESPGTVILRIEAEEAAFPIGHEYIVAALPCAEARGRLVLDPIVVPQERLLDQQVIQALDAWKLSVDKEPKAKP